MNFSELLRGLGLLTGAPCDPQKL